jgi:hypothetical protein
MSTMFDDAIADARKLKMLAEENAKNKIIDAMAPKIRFLIEQELMGDEESFDSIEDVLDLDDESFEDDDSSQTVNINVNGEANIAVSSGEMAVETEEDEEEDLLVNLNAESARALANLIRDPSKLQKNVGLIESLDGIAKNLNALNRLLNHVGTVKRDSTLWESVRKYYTQLLKEMISLRKDVILTEGTANAKNIRLKYNFIVKEIKKMSKRRTNTLFDRLFEGQYEGDRKGDLDEFDVVFDEDDVEVLGVENSASLEDLDVDVVVQGEEEAEEEISDEVLETYLSGLSEQDEEIEFAEDEVEAEASPIEDVIPVEDAEAALEDLGAALGLDLTVGAEEEEVEVGEEAEEEVLEIDEAVLRKELRRMRRIREQDEAVDADPYLDHGGEDLGDVIVDVDEEDLINALADELGSAEVDVPVVERRRRRQTKGMNESRKNHALKKKLVEYRKAVGTLKGQLTEMNLFNAKLLYVNKLMQNRNLNTKQQRAIVEALDNAKTLREAKLLYKSLTASLNKRGPKGSLAEGRNPRTLGSSSRSIRSASATNNGNEVDRWAVLAGISNKN